MKTPPERALPGLRIRDRAPLRLILRLERRTAKGLRVSAIDQSLLSDGLVQEFFNESTAATGLQLPIAASSSGVEPLDRWLTKRREIADRITEQPALLRVEIGDEIGAEETARIVSRAIVEGLGR